MGRGGGGFRMGEGEGFGFCLNVFLPFLPPCVMRDVTLVWGFHKKRIMMLFLFLFDLGVLDETETYIIVSFLNLFFFFIYNKCYFK